MFLVFNRKLPEADEVVSRLIWPVKQMYGTKLKSLLWGTNQTSMANQKDFLKMFLWMSSVGGGGGGLGSGGSTSSKIKINIKNVKCD